MRRLPRKPTFQCFENRLAMDGSAMDASATDIAIDCPTGSEQAKIEDIELLDQYMLRTVGNNMDIQASEPSLDVNGDSLVSALDVLIIVNMLNESQSNFVQISRSSVDSVYDVNQDGDLSVLDALWIVNALNNPQELISDGDSGDATDRRSTLAYIDIDGWVESMGEDARRLDLADVGSYGVLRLEIDGTGNVLAIADGVDVKCTVSENGGLAIGDLMVPARLVKTSSGKLGLIPGGLVQTDESITWS